MITISKTLQFNKDGVGMFNWPDFPAFADIFIEGKADRFGGYDSVSYQTHEHAITVTFDSVKGLWVAGIWGKILTGKWKEVKDIYPILTSVEKKAGPAIQTALRSLPKFPNWERSDDGFSSVTYERNMDGYPGLALDITIEEISDLFEELPPIDKNVRIRLADYNGRSKSGKTIQEVKSEIKKISEIAKQVAAAEKILASYKLTRPMG